MNCPRCGAPLKEGNKFCTSCGLLIPLNTEAVDAAAVTEPARPAEEPQPIPFVAEGPEEAPVSDVPAEENEAAEEQPVFVNEAANEAEPQNVPESAPYAVPGEPIPAGQEPVSQLGPVPGQPFEPQPYQPQAVPFQGQPYQPQPYQVPPVPPQASAAQPSQGKKKFPVGALIGIIAGALAVIVLIVLLATGVFVKEPEPITINLNDYVITEFEGYSYAGSLKSCGLDKERLLADYGDSIKYTKAARKELGSMTRKMTAAEFFDVNVLNNLYLHDNDYSFTLKNGDTVKLEWTDYGLSQLKWTNVTLEYGTAEVKVSGLTDTEQFDPFESLSVTFSGENGKGSAKIEEPSETIYDYMYFDYPYTDTLSNGDSFTVTLDMSDSSIAYLAENFRKVPSQMSKTYTVEGLIVAEKFDPFESIHIEYTGFNGYGKAEVVLNDDADPAAGELDFSASPSFFLKNGDEITVDFYWSDYRRDEMVLQYGLEPSVLSKTFTVEGLDHYVEALSEIPQETLDAIDKTNREKMLELLEELNTNEKFTQSPNLTFEAELVETRLYKRTDTDGNRLYFIYQITVKGNGNYSKSYYTTFYYNSVSTHEGTVEPDSKDCNTDSSYMPSQSTREQFTMTYETGGYRYTFTMYGSETMEEQEKVISDALGDKYELVPKE